MDREALIEELFSIISENLTLRSDLFVQERELEDLSKYGGHLLEFAGMVGNALRNLPWDYVHLYVSTAYFNLIKELHGIGQLEELEESERVIERDVHFAQQHREQRRHSASALAIVLGRLAGIDAFEVDE